MYLGSCRFLRRGEGRWGLLTLKVPLTVTVATVMPGCSVINRPRWDFQVSNSKRAPLLYEFLYYCSSALFGLMSLAASTETTCTLEARVKCQSFRQPGARRFQWLALVGQRVPRAPSTFLRTALMYIIPMFKWVCRIERRPSWTRHLVTREQAERTTCTFFEPQS